MDDNVFTLVGRKLDGYEDELKTYLASGRRIVWNSITEWWDE